MADNNITFAKIVANPSAYSWSQAYNAGKLFAVISLETKEELKEADYLNVLGREILDTLEQEFFTLETKDLTSIKQAVTVTKEKIPSDIICSFVIATYVDNVLYLYILGGGKVSLKRGEKLGILLESQETDVKEFKDASGYLQDGDTVILQTKQFADTVSTQTLSEFLETKIPSEIAEHLAPLIHEKDEPAAASIIINYKSLNAIINEAYPEAIKENTEEIEEDKDEEDEWNDNTKEEIASPFYSPSVEEKTNLPEKLKGIFSDATNILKKRPGNELDHPRKVILTIVIVVVVIFIASVIFAINKQQSAKTESVFNAVFPQASKKYEEGKSLLGLNEGLAQDSFKQAKQILEENINKLPKNSSQEKQLLTLLSQVNNELSQGPKPNIVSAKSVDTVSSNLLNAESKNQGLYFTYDKNNIYLLTSGNIYSLKLNGTGKNSIITNDSDWTTPAGLATYFGNLYVLDKKQNQILKFVEVDSTYSKSNYFSDNSSVNFSKAISIAIDSSVYVLSTNGSIAKYTKGASESFNLSGLDKDLSNPTRIFTNADTNNVYVLDNGNSRIVVLDKTGKYVAQYQAGGVIKSAKDLDVDEANKKAYVLSGGKVYEIDLK
jgi:hypothetical protein